SVKNKSARPYRTVRLLLDTNATVGRRYRLYGPHMAIIEIAIANGILELIVPQIVVEEVKNKYREELLKAERNLTETLVKQNTLLAADEQRALKQLKIDRVVTDFGDRLDNRLAELRARRPVYTDVPHQDLVQRDLDRRRPFQESGRGYRDALLWETLLRQTDPKKPIFFVTKNSKDFCEGDGLKLHNHLASDLGARGLPASTVVICESVEAFVDDHLKALLLNAQMLREGHLEQYGKFDFRNFFAENKDDLLIRLTSQLERSDPRELMSFDTEDLTIVSIEDPSSVSLLKAYELEKDKLFLTFAVVAEVTLEFFVFKSDYYSMPEHVNFEIQDFDWNDHYIWASKAVLLPLKLSIELTTDTPNKVESFDVE